MPKRMLKILPSSLSECNLNEFKNVLQNVPLLNNRMSHFPWRQTRELVRWLTSKESVCNVKDTGDGCSITGPGRSPGGGNGNPLQDFCLENPIDKVAWQATVHRVTKSQTQLKQLSMHASRYKPDSWKYIFIGEGEL